MTGAPPRGEVSHWFMPTSRPRHQVTETTEVARALDLAAGKWPNESRAQLLLRLVAAGELALRRADEQAQLIRREAVLALSGSYSDVFAPDYLSQLRDDWAT